MFDQLSLRKKLGGLGFVPGVLTVIVSRGSR
jgi:hypothetical protein